MVVNIDQLAIPSARPAGTKLETIEELVNYCVLRQIHVVLHFKPLPDSILDNVRHQTVIEGVHNVIHALPVRTAESVTSESE
jgi:hypothetical protein